MFKSQHCLSHSTVFPSKRSARIAFICSLFSDTHGTSLKRGESVFLLNPVADSLVSQYITLRVFKSLFMIPGRVLGKQLQHLHQYDVIELIFRQTLNYSVSMGWYLQMSMCHLVQHTEEPVGFVICIGVSGWRGAARSVDLVDGCLGRSELSLLSLLIMFHLCPSLCQLLLLLFTYV